VSWIDNLHGQNYNKNGVSIGRQHLTLSFTLKGKFKIRTTMPKFFGPLFLLFHNTIFDCLV
jgi:hypothetical protein